METQNLLGKRVISIGDDSKGMHGILVKITNGRYPFIVEFDSGSCYGVTEVTLEKSDREKAIEWWNSLSGKLKQINLIIKYLPNRPKSLKLDNITGREIEQIWREETQQEKEERLQVDFELLKIQVQDFSNDESYSEGARNNLKLFFDLLSKSSTFAHKAHKELNKLMK
jgi:hypothetical protein